MSNKIYVILLTLFIGFILFLNIVTFIFSKNPSQLFNLYNVKERTSAVILLMQHIIFESGLIVKDIEQKDVEQSILKFSNEYNVDPNLIRTIIDQVKNYVIYEDGSIGIMKIKTEMLENFHGKDPYIFEDNIQIGTYYLSELLQRYDVHNALIKYFNNKSLADETFQRYSNSIL